MTVLGFAFDSAHSSGAVLSIPRYVAQVVELLREAVRAAKVPMIRDYRLADLDGGPLGTIRAAVARPRVGVNERTVYLHREF